MKVLHVGCGASSLRDIFPGWEEIRLDIEPRFTPDIVSSVLDMDVEDRSMDAVYMSHVLEHLYAHETDTALKEVYRVLKPNGLAVILVPDVQALGEHISKGNLDAELYTAPAGPISVCDVLWGFRPSLAKGHGYMAHKFGFTARSLENSLKKAGFKQVKVERNIHDIVAQCSPEGTERKMKSVSK